MTPVGIQGNKQKVVPGSSVSNLFRALITEQPLAVKARPWTRALTVVCSKSSELRCGTGAVFRKSPMGYTTTMIGDDRVHWAVKANSVFRGATFGSRACGLHIQVIGCT